MAVALVPHVFRQSIDAKHATLELEPRDCATRFPVDRQSMSFAVGRFHIVDLVAGIPVEVGATPLENAGEVLLQIVSAQGKIEVVLGFLGQSRLKNRK